MTTTKLQVLRRYPLHVLQMMCPAWPYANTGEDWVESGDMRRRGPREAACVLQSDVMVFKIQLSLHHVPCFSVILDKAECTAAVQTADALLAHGQSLMSRLLQGASQGRVHQWQAANGTRWHHEEDRERRGLTAVQEDCVTQQTACPWPCESVISTDWSRLSMQRPDGWRRVKCQHWYKFQDLSRHQRRTLMIRLLGLDQCGRLVRTATSSGYSRAKPQSLSKAGHVLICVITSAILLRM